jgi:hypothetical protein
MGDASFHVLSFPKREEDERGADVANSAPMKVALQLNAA